MSLVLKNQIFEKLSKGVSPREISQELGCSRTYISNVKTGRHEKRYIQIKKKIQIAYLWGADRCVTSIAKELNLEKAVIIRFLQDENLM